MKEACPNSSDGLDGLMLSRPRVIKRRLSETWGRLFLILFAFSLQP